jgi:hypothetical protein
MEQGQAGWEEVAIEGHLGCAHPASDESAL